MIKKYVKKPIEVEAVQWTETNYRELDTFTGHNIGINYKDMYVRTLEGKMTFKKGDYIVKGSHGEFYPVKEEIFKDTYEVVK